MGPYQSVPTKTKHHSPAEENSVSYSYLSACASEMQGWRNGMEDSHILQLNINNEGISIFGVFDGHGGKEVAKFVERHYIEEITNLESYKQRNFEKALIESFDRMDELMEGEAGQQELNQIRAGPNEEQSGGQSYAGCTANVALFYKNDLYVSNAGDSRSVLCRNKTAFAMSEDHKPDNAEEKKRISSAGGFVSEGRVNGNLNLSRAMGDLEYKSNKDLPRDAQLIISKPDVKHTKLDANDEFLLMGCDGIWECESNEDLISFCKTRIDEGKDLKSINTELLDKILASDTSNGVGCDNMSLILINFTATPN